MLYCDNCFLAFEGDVCPKCGKKHLEPVSQDDLCFLTEKEQIWSGMLDDVLTQNDIFHVQKGVLGAAIAMRVGPALEKYRFYVPYGDLSRAEDIVTGLFTPTEPVDNGDTETDADE